MILTCHDCPRQISFPGSKRDHFALLFGWAAAAGEKYRCSTCAGAHGFTCARGGAGTGKRGLNEPLNKTETGTECMLNPCSTG